MIETKENMMLFKSVFDEMAHMLHKKALPREELRKAWELLKAFSFEQITKAIDGWLLTDKYYMPTVGELIATIKNSEGQTTGELKTMNELRTIKSKFGTTETENYYSSRCARCDNTGYVILLNPKTKYTAVFACSCWKGVPKSERLNTYVEAMQNGWTLLTNELKKEKQDEKNI